MKGLTINVFRFVRNTADEPSRTKNHNIPSSFEIDTTNKNAYGEPVFVLDPKEKYRTFHTAEEADAWGNYHYSAWAEIYKKGMKTTSNWFDDQPTSPIEKYCGELYSSINETLRRSSSSSGRTTIKEFAHCLTSTLIYAPRIPENIIVYRLVCDSFIRELLENNLNSAPTIEKGFMSTSLVVDITQMTSGPYHPHQNLLKIYVPKGTCGIYVNAVTRRLEQEMLIRRKSTLGLVNPPYFDSTLNKYIFECSLSHM